MSHVSNDDYVVFQQTSSSSWLDSAVEEFLELHQVVANLHSRDLPCACAMFLESTQYIYIYFMSSLNSTTAGALPRRPMTPQRRLEVPSFICDLWQQNASYLWWFTICSDSFSLYSRAFDIGPTQWRPVFQPYPTCFEPHMFNYNKKSLATTAEKLHLFNFFLLLPVLLAILASISFTYQFVNNVEKQQQSLS